MKQVSCFVATIILSGINVIALVLMGVILGTDTVFGLSFVVLSVPYFASIFKLYDIAIFADKNYKLGDTI